ncbi:lysophospholipid acyltransferase family protein [Tenacibaculum sp. 190524A02b]|uniref:GNAT family N-acetyltransferase n=1 Tax=Tenacibaculum vairaonense TaxID=3137860 RepID=UPI0031FA4C1C
MGLVNSKEIAKVLNVGKAGFLGTFIGWIVLKVLRIDAVNKLYDDNKHLPDIEFLRGILKDMKVKYEISDEDLERVPKNGSFITVSNHPMGGVDAILLLKIMLEVRPDFKATANFFAQRVAPVQSIIIPVNPFENRKKEIGSLGAFEKCLTVIGEGKPLGLFPAGEVSTIKDGNIFQDRKWGTSSIKLIQKSQVPVVPLYFHAKNSNLFYWLSGISGFLRTAKLPSEFFTQKKKIVKVRIGNPIPVKDQNRHTNIEDLSNFLREKTYVLANSYNETFNS